jgi:acyl dehydratase
VHPHADIEFGSLHGDCCGPTSERRSDGIEDPRRALGAHLAFGEISECVQRGARVEIGETNRVDLDDTNPVTLGAHTAHLPERSRCARCAGDDGEIDGRRQRAVVEMAHAAARTARRVVTGGDGVPFVEEVPFDGDGVAGVVGHEEDLHGPIQAQSGALRLGTEVPSCSTLCPMPLNPDAVGATGDVRTISWTSKDALLYAVGIGAGQADLPFTTENTKDVTQVVYPTFAVVAGSGTASPGASAMSQIGSFNFALLVHGSQAITLHRPIPVEANATVQDRVVAMYDKGKAAVVVTEAETKLASGEPLWTTRSAVFIRGEGGWGGDRGPSGPQNEPPADTAPDHEITLQTSPDQAFVYRLSGDRNPLHTDPSFAAIGGFDRPILHGLCTYGFTGRAILGALVDRDVTRFHHIEGRFSAPVMPGDSLTVRIWRTADGEAVFTTSVADRTVIDQGLVRFS